MSMIADLNEFGTNAHPRLAAEVQSLLDIPMDDSIGESPHSLMTRLARHSPGSTWPWDASSHRLKQNLTDYDLLVPKLGFKTQQAWDRYTSIVRFDAKVSAYSNARSLTAVGLQMMQNMVIEIGFTNAASA